jgi:uncharacterized protein YecE (DUF72 family)
MIMEYRIGCSGFYNKHWKGIFYPIDMPQNKWFVYYAGRLNTLELNVTFYRFPQLKMLQEWRSKSPDDFLFSVKAPRIITHLKKFNDCESLIDDFYNVCSEGLQEKLGPLLFQLPPSFSYTEERLDKLCNSMRPGFINVIEFRHLSWWQQPVFDVLADHGIVFCHVSHPDLPEDLVVNGDIAYVRLHGRPDMFYSPYSTEYLENLKIKLAAIQGLKRVFIYFNNTAGEAGILNAMELQKITKISE